MKLLDKLLHVQKDILKKEDIKITVTMTLPIKEEPKIEKLRLLRPVPKEFKISSPFGPRINPVTRREMSFHNGIDFACPHGTQVRSCVDSTVYKIGYEDPKNKALGLGLRVWTSFKWKGCVYYLWYGHLSEIFVAEGQTRAAGAIIGLSGNSGRSTGPHLHVQVRKKCDSKFYDAEFYDQPNPTQFEVA